MSQKTYNRPFTESQVNGTQPANQYHYIIYPLVTGYKWARYLSDGSTKLQFVDHVYSTSSGAYPNGGVKNGYYYEHVSTQDNLIPNKKNDPDDDGRVGYTVRTSQISIPQETRYREESQTVTNTENLYLYIEPTVTLPQAISDLTIIGMGCTGSARNYNIFLKERASNVYRFGFNIKGESQSLATFSYASTHNGTYKYLGSNNFGYGHYTDYYSDMTAGLTTQLLSGNQLRNYSSNIYSWEGGNNGSPSADIFKGINNNRIYLIITAPQLGGTRDEILLFYKTTYSSTSMTGPSIISGIESGYGAWTIDGTYYLRAINVGSSSLPQINVIRLTAGSTAFAIYPASEFSVSTREFYTPIFFIPSVIQNKFMAVCNLNTYPPELAVAKLSYNTAGTGTVDIDSNISAPTDYISRVTGYNASNFIRRMMTDDGVQYIHINYVRNNGYKYYRLNPSLSNLTVEEISLADAFNGVVPEELITSSIECIHSPYGAGFVRIKSTSGTNVTLQIAFYGQKTTQTTEIVQIPYTVRLGTAQEMYYKTNPNNSLDKWTGSKPSQICYVRADQYDETQEKKHMGH